MSQYSRLVSPSYKSYTLLKKKLLDNDNRMLLRLDCMNPVKSLEKPLSSAKVINNSNGSNGSQTYTYHNTIFEKLLNRKIIPSLGVRDSILNTMKIFNGHRFSIPSDVYPVYTQLANSVNLTYTPFRLGTKSNNFKPNIHSIIQSLTNNNSKACLLPIPYHPYGYIPTFEDINYIINWLHADKDRIIIIDNVYSYILDTRTQNELDMKINKLINTSQCFSFTSLSKSHISPLKLGINYVPSHHVKEFEQNVTKPDLDDGVNIMN